MRHEQQRSKAGALAGVVMAALLGLSLTARAQPSEPPQPPALSMRAFAMLTPLRHAAFAAQWQALLNEDLSRLRDAPERERIRQRFVWAQGRVMYPYFHWRDAPAPGALQADPMLPQLLRDLPLYDPAWWPLAEVQAFWRAWLHEDARALMQQDPSLRRGDARWLRAEVAALHRSGLPRVHQRELMGRMLAAYVDDNGSQGIDGVVEQWRAMAPPAADLARIQAAIDANRARECCHESAVLREWQGVDLRVHVLEPRGAAATAALRPAMLWLHGGSFTEGQWWHSPVISAALQEQGVLVLALDLRTSTRFDTGPLEQLSDASLAYEWLQKHAARLRVDPQRVGVAGFSSGAVLALMLATHGLDPEAEKGRSPSVKHYPAAVVSLGGCPDPLNPRKDGWFRRQVERVAPPERFSPMAQVSSGQPPLIAFHGTEDEYCPFDDMKRFVAAYSAAGNPVELVAIEGAPHFFGFFHQPGQARVRATLAKALERWGWSAR